MGTQYVVEGARKDTGVEQQLVIEADDAEQAECIANGRGLFTSAVRPVESNATFTSLAVKNENWQSSPAHLLLLSKFRDGASTVKYRSADYWQTALKEKPATVIAQFITEGMLEPGGLPERLDEEFKASDLKSMLRQKGLAFSGRKEELIRRLIDDDATAMAALVADVEVYRCTAQAMQLAESYCTMEKEKRAVAEQEALDLLVRGAYSKAASVVAHYEATQVFSRGLGIDWKNHDTKSEAEPLKVIFTSMPAILKGIEEDPLRQLRLAAGMMLLWGTGTARGWVPKAFETGIHLDSDAVCRALVFHAEAERHLDEMEYLGAEDAPAQVEWSTGGDDGVCPACAALNGHVFTVKRARGMMPHAKCASEDGCRCSWSPVLG